MDDGIRTRLLVLVGLVTVSSGLAGAGAALGLTESLASTPSGEFVVDDDHLTFESSGESKTVVGNLSNVRAVTIEETDTGQFTIQTVEDRPLTDRERARVREITLANETVRSVLAEMGSYELSVDPIEQLNASAFDEVSYDLDTSTETSDGISIVEITEGEHSGSVTVTREPNYLENRVSVRIRQPTAPETEDLKYSLEVDLVDETVTDITDWDEIRRESSTVNATKQFNMTDIEG